MRHNGPKLSIFILSSLLLIFVCFAGQAFCGDRLDRIIKEKVIRVGTPGDYRPFSILENGKYSGHDIDVIEMMARELGVEIQYVPTSWPTIMKDYADDKFDIAVGGLARTLTRAKAAELLPPYAPFAKVALVRVEQKDKFKKPEDLNRPDVRVIKNPGGTNEIYVDTNLKKAQVALHPVNNEIPGMIAEGKGDVMITEHDEARAYVKKDARLYAAYMDAPLTPFNFKGFMMQKDDPDYTRVMNFIWSLLDLRGELGKSADKWLR